MKAIIIGFMGSGKTTVSRLLAQKLGCRAFDLDEYIVENERRSVKQIFEEDGEDYFRKREHELLLEILKEDMKEHKIDYDNIFITHSKAEAGKEYLYNELKSLVPEECIKVSNAGCVISSHCGPGTIGILYILED